MKKFFASMLFFLIIFCMSSVAISAELFVSWDPNPPEEGVVGYKVFQGLSSGNYDIVIDVGNNTSFVAIELEGDTMYYYAVKAYDAAGNESLFSNEASCRTLDTVPPSAPTGLIISNTQ